MLSSQDRSDRFLPPDRPNGIAPLGERISIYTNTRPEGNLSPELSIVMPCLNEAQTVGVCLEKAQQFLDLHHVEGELIVADNGSTDGSQATASACGTQVVTVPERGYGAALARGIASARGRYIIMGDSDDSYDFRALQPFVERLRAGFSLVVGNRFQGGIQPGAMPFLHQYFGNPFLTGLGRLLFGSPCRDFYCGLRGFTRAAFETMQLKSQGMEFALEMIVKATHLGLPITEVPTRLVPDGRNRPPHLRTWQDGWRSLTFLLGASFLERPLGQALRRPARPIEHPGSPNTL